MIKDYATIANRYAQNIVSGRISACKYVQQACQRHLDDLKHLKDYIFNPELERDGVKFRPGDRVCRFLENCVHTTGEWKGQQFKLEDWQVFIVCVGFGWIEKSTGLRRYREIYLEVPRKNGKSLLAGLLGLYMMCADGEHGAEIFAGANNEEQANKVFVPAWLNVNSLHDIQEYYGVQIHGKEAKTGRLSRTSDYSRFERLIGNPKDGDNPSCYLCDEFHEHDTPFQYDTMRTGMGSRRQPMTIITTTAGVSKDGPCYEKRAQVVSVLKKSFENNQLFGVIYTVDEGDDWREMSSWHKANPNFGVSFFEEYAKQQLQEAEQTVSKQAIIKCKNLNIWLDSYTSWLDMDYWNKSGDTSLSEDEFIGKYPCFHSSDLAATQDLCARVRLYDKDGTYYIFPTFYLPEETAKDPSKTHYLQWIHHGYIQTNPGLTIDFNVIEDDIFDFVVSCPTLLEAPFDRWQAMPLISSLEKRLEDEIGTVKAEELCVEFKQNVRNYSDPMKHFEKALKDGKIIHDGNPVLTWCMGNITVKPDKNDNIFPVKESPSQKIDGGTATLMAFARAYLNPESSNNGANDGTLINY